MPSQPIQSSRARWRPCRWLVLFALSATAATLPATARATVVERVVAVVGEKAILFSDLRDRARPMLLRVHTEVPAGAQRSAAISQVYKVLLDSLIDEELELRAASRSKIVVTAKEIDDALARIASQNKLSVEQVIEEATRAGLSERQYRSELRRQVLEAKLLNLRLQGRIRVTDEDTRGAYRRIVLEERRKHRFRPAWIVLPIPSGASSDALAEQRRLAESISQQAANGADFAELARQHSSDTRTRASGGLLAWMKPGQLAPLLDRIALSLAAGQVSGPVRLDDRLVILKVVERDPSELPSYEDARSELAERVYMEKMNKARRQWLDSLRRRTHVDVRL
ncbi:MAG TPA: peptidylprolyl isomerase [Polyangiaceae bacterium]|nr:peptidylprolyl isomerase [Polyangiaceae bacterium]